MYFLHNGTENPIVGPTKFVQKLDIFYIHAGQRLSAVLLHKATFSTQNFQCNIFSANILSEENLCNIFLH